MVGSLQYIIIITPHAHGMEELVPQMSRYSVELLDTFDAPTLKLKPCDLALVDLGMLADLSRTGEGYDYRLGLEQLHPVTSGAPVVVLVEPDSLRKAIRAIKAGGKDYLTYPVNVEELKLVVETVQEEILREGEVEYLREQSMDLTKPDYCTSNSLMMRKIYDQVRRVAATRSTVLITGQTGTGKSLLARQIHALSTRSAAPFIGVHCGAIPETLLESELFGHEKGAFTGAIRQKLGKFDIARGGTIFLDEIGTVTAATQVKLLQVLQERTFCRIGGEVDIEADVRIVAATNDDLLELCQNGRFRQDLYYRLNVFPIYLPGLKERIEDLPLLVDIFIQRMKAEMQTNIRRLHDSVFQAFKTYDWPGNIRELENLIERACILADSDTLMPDDFPVGIFSDRRRVLPIPELGGKLEDVRQRMNDDLERKYLHELLTRHRGRIAPVADEAGIGTRQVHKLMVKHDIHKEDYK